MGGREAKSQRFKKKTGLIHEKKKGRGYESNYRAIKIKPRMGIPNNHEKKERDRDDKKKKKIKNKKTGPQTKLGRLSFFM